MLYWSHRFPTLWGWVRGCAVGHGVRQRLRFGTVPQHSRTPLSRTMSLRTDQACICKCGGQGPRHGTWRGQRVTTGIDVSKALLQRSAVLRPQATRYRSVTGVGSLTAALQVAFLPAWGQRNSKALTSLVGLALWSQTRPAVDPGRSGCCAPRAVHGSPVHDPAGRHPPTLPSGPAATRQNGQGRPSCSHAQTTPAPDCVGPPRDTLVATGEVAL